MSKQAAKIIKQRQAYRRCFLGDDEALTKDAQIVLADLAKFCRWYQAQSVVSRTSNSTDVPATFQAIGRREVYARLIANLFTDDAMLFKIVNNGDEDE